MNRKECPCFVLTACINVQIPYVQNICNAVEAFHNGVRAEATENNANTDHVTQSDTTDTTETENATRRVSTSLEGDSTNGRHES